MVLEQVALIHTGSQQRVALKVQHLPIAVGGDAHVADQHVRKTPFVWFPHSGPFRHSLSCKFWGANKAFQRPSLGRRESYDFRQIQFRQSAHGTHHRWRVHWVSAPGRSCFVCLCYRNGPFVSSGLLTMNASMPAVWLASLRKHETSWKRCC